MQDEKGRVEYLDGLRGVAALIVVIHHAVVALYPHMFFGLENGVVASWQTTFAASPASILVNGSFAVYVFFALSGFVIATSADRPSSFLPGKIVARIFRLGIPASASVLLATALAATGFMFPADAAKLIGHWWLATWHPEFSLASSLPEISGAYFWRGTSDLNPVLWTMQRELIGSVAIYIVFAALKTTNARLFACGITTLAVMVARAEPYFYLCFCSGSALYLLRGKLPSRLPTIGLAVLSIGILCGGYPFNAPPAGSFYELPSAAFKALRISPLYFWTIGASAILFGTLVSPVLQRAFSLPPCRFLGRISFGLYLVHFLVLSTFLTNAYVIFGHQSSASALVCVALYVAISFVCAWIFTVWVDEPAQRLTKKVTLIGSLKLPTTASAIG